VSECRSVGVSECRVGIRWVIVSSSDEILRCCGSGCHNSTEQHQSLRHARWVASNRSLHRRFAPSLHDSHATQCRDAGSLTPNTNARCTGDDETPL